MELLLQRVYSLLKIKAISITLIVFCALFIGSGIYAGVCYGQALNLIKQGDKLMAIGQYDEAAEKYRLSTKKFKFLQQKAASKISLLTDLQQDEQIKQAQANYKNGDWQKCLDVLSDIKNNSQKYDLAQKIFVTCQQKLSDSKATSDFTEQNSNSDASSNLNSCSNTNTNFGGQTSGNQGGRGQASQPSSASSSEASSNGPSIGQTADTGGSSSGNSASGDSGSSSSSEGSSSSNNSNSLASCSGNNYYSTSPIATSDLLSITPLGNFSPTGGHIFPTGHIYFFIRKSNPSDWNSAPVETNLYAPGDITITRITASEHITDGFTDYSLTFSPCSQISSTFGHVTTLSQSILDQFNQTTGGNTGSPYTTGGKTFRTTDKTVSIQVSSGTQLGTAGGRVDQNALDFGTKDTRISPLSFANNDRWSSDTRHSVCPIDYYSASTKSTLSGFLGYLTTRRTVSPVCGEVSQDVANTAQGAWIKAEGSANPEDPNLTLAHDNVEPGYGAIVVGTGLSGVERSTNFFSPTHSETVNREFSEVTNDGTVYCYETSTEKGQSSNNSFFIQLTSPTALTIQKNTAGICGTGPWSLDSSASNFER